MNRPFSESTPMIFQLQEDHRNDKLEGSAENDPWKPGFELAQESKSKENRE
jgi:hypothetical protein